MSEKGNENIHIKKGNENIHIYPTLDVSGQNKVLIIHGKELDPVPPVPVEISGDIDSPARFWGLRHQDYNPQKCHVLVRDSSIELILNEDDGRTRGTVVGTIVLDPECGMWGINNENITYSNEALAKLVKANEYLFDKQEEWRALYAALRAFKGNVQVAITNVKEISGDAERATRWTVENNVPKSFTLKTRIYGQEREAYKVDVGAEVIGHDVKFFLDSSQLAFRKSELKDVLLKKYTQDFLGSIVVIKM